MDTDAVMRLRGHLPVRQRSQEQHRAVQLMWLHGCRWMVMKVLRTLIVMLIGIVAVSVPGFELFVSFIGSLCCAPLAFIIPATCHLVLYQGKLGWHTKAMNYCMLLFGFTGMVFGVAHGIAGFVEALEAQSGGGKK